MAMRFSEIPVSFLRGVRTELRACLSPEENFISDHEMPIVARFCEAKTHPSDCAQAIIQDRRERGFVALPVTHRLDHSVQDHGSRLP